MVSNEVGKASGKFALDGSLCFENMATRFVPLQNFASQQKHAKQNLKNTAFIDTLFDFEVKSNKVSINESEDKTFFGTYNTSADFLRIFRLSLDRLG